jgi:hypothetical protein
MATELIDNPEVEEDETDVEAEPTGRSGVVKPWDPKKIRITTKNFSLREVVEQIQQQETDLAPDCELALRFCAFRGYDEDDYRRHSSLDAYLVDFTRRLDKRAEAGRNISDEHLLQLERDFDQAMRNACSALGQAAFRRWPTGVTRRGPINRAVFESQALALADHREERVAERSAEIIEAFRALFSDEGYLRSVTVGTGDPASIALRLSRTRQAVEAILR